MKAPVSKGTSTLAMPGLRLAAALVLLLATLAPRPVSALDVPYLSGPVVDEAHLLDAATTDHLDQQLRQLKQDTGVQLQVLTIPTLEGEPLEDYSLKVAETWKLGRKGTDRGVLLLIAKDDRKIRFEVGYGLEALLTDAQCRRVIANVITPRFREGDFNGGIQQAVDAVAGTLRGQPDLIPEEPERQKPSGLGGFLVMFLLFFVIPALRAPGAGAWLLYVFLMPFIFGLPAAMFGPTMGVIALAVWAVGFPILRRILPPPRPSSSSRGRRGGWISGGGFGGGGGWSSGGGGGGGGWSRGGGSFGGGGASGSW